MIATTVEELIHALQEFDPTTRIKFDCGDYECPCTVDEGGVSLLPDPDLGVIIKCSAGGEE